jgi:hypothetical protein
MTYKALVAVLQAQRSSAVQVSTSGMPLGDTKGCQKGTEKPSRVNISQDLQSLSNSAFKFSGFD